LCLDLSDTKSYVHAGGEVVWHDRTGRVGVRFSDLPEPARKDLKQWLFANAIAACVNHEADQAAADEAMLGGAILAVEDGSVPDHTSVLTALAAVESEVQARGANLDGALQLVAERAHAFVRASGAAIALSQGEDMVCCASSGEAPPVASRLQVGSGFSGECVRTGKLLRCEDSETDAVVDRESCRALGIRSMVAVPITFGGNVMGLLEVFSPAAYAFTDGDNSILTRFADMVLGAVKEATRPVEAQAASVPASSATVEAPVGEDAIPGQTSTIQRVLIIAGVAALGVILTWTFAPSSRGSANVSPSTAVKAVRPTPPRPVPAATTLEGLRRLAEQGDPVAQFAVGARYATGDDVKQDYAEAVRWFTRAAEQGHVIAQATLGAYYWAGRGVPQDISKAYFWSVLAQAGGDEASKYRVAVLTSRMSRSQVVAAQQQANDWIKRHQVESRSASN
jgi:putative methionine-R-sulfoxide reductase with GAF domain